MFSNRDAEFVSPQLLFSFQEKEVIFLGYFSNND